MAKRKKKSSKKSVSIRILYWGIIAFGFFCLVTFGQVAAIRYIDPPFTVGMIWAASIRLLSETPAPDADYRWRSLDEISPHLPRAVLAGEDQRFFFHNGFDGIEMEATLKDFVKTGRIRGASTITMQAARSLFLPRCRNVFRKIFEAWYTVLMEVCWTKHRILEIYLNTVDWGDNIVGAGAASVAYYGKQARALSKNEAALLAAVLPNPHRFSPVRPDKFVRKRQKRILKDMTLMPMIGSGVAAGR